MAHAAPKKVVIVCENGKKKITYINCMGNRVIPIKFREPKPSKNPIVRQPPQEPEWVDTNEDEGITPGLLSLEAREDQNVPIRKIPVFITRSGARLYGFGKLTRNIGPDIRKKQSHQRKVTTGKPQKPTKPMKAVVVLPVKVLIPHPNNRVSRVSSVSTRVTRSKRFEETPLNCSTPISDNFTEIIRLEQETVEQNEDSETDSYSDGRSSLATCIEELDTSFESYGDSESEDSIDESSEQHQNMISQFVDKMGDCIVLVERLAVPNDQVVSNDHPIDPIAPPNITCQVCNRSFCTVGVKNRHERQFHRDAQSEMYSCSHKSCMQRRTKRGIGRNFAYKRDLIRHLKSHTVKFYPCPVCRYPFMEERCRVVHQREFDH